MLGNDPRSWYLKLGTWTAIAIEVVVVPLIMTLGALWIDKRWGLSPWAIIISVPLSLVWLVFRLLSQLRTKE